MSSASLSAADYEFLFDFLDDCADQHETMSLFQALGYIAGDAVSPVKTDRQQWQTLIFAATPSDSNLEQAVKLLHLVRNQVQRQLANDEALELPWEQELLAEDEAVAQWCQGFLEAVFTNEKAWFNQQEEATAELLLPIMALSGLYDEEYQELLEDDNLLAQLYEQIPEIAQDCYAFFRAQSLD